MLYIARGTLVVGPRGREAVYTVDRSSTVGYAALQVACEELLRRCSCQAGMEEMIRRGASLTVSVVTQSEPVGWEPLSRQVLQDDLTARERVEAIEAEHRIMTSDWATNAEGGTRDAKGG